MGVAHACVLAILTFTSVVGNGLVCAVLLKRRQFMTPSSRFVLSLCSCDLAVSVLVLPFAFVSALQENWEFGDFWCSASAFLWLLATSASNGHVAVVALDRYFAIVTPLRYSVASSKCGVMLSCIWSLALLVSILPFFCGIRFVYQPLHATCLVRWDDSLAFTFSFLALSFVFPALVMLLCYGCIFRIACSKYEKVRIGTISALVIPGNVPRQPYSRKPSWLSVVLKSPVKGFAVIFVLLGSFFLLWTPYVVTCLLQVLRLSWPLPWQQQVAFLASLISLPSHPLVYGLLNRSIRKNLFLQLFGRRSGLSSVASPQRTSTVGLLDYTPAWTAQNSLYGVHNGSETHPYILECKAIDGGFISSEDTTGSNTLDIVSSVDGSESSGPTITTSDEDQIKVAV